MYGNFLIVLDIFRLLRKVRFMHRGFGRRPRYNEVQIYKNVNPQGWLCERRQNEFITNTKVPR